MVKQSLGNPINNGTDSTECSSCSVSFDWAVSGWTIALLTIFGLLIWHCLLSPDQRQWVRLKLGEARNNIREFCEPIWTALGQGLAWTWERIAGAATFLWETISATANFLWSLVRPEPQPGLPVHGGGVGAGGDGSGAGAQLNPSGSGNLPPPPPPVPPRQNRPVRVPAQVNPPQAQVDQERQGGQDEQVGPHGEGVEPQAQLDRQDGQDGHQVHPRPLVVPNVVNPLLQQVPPLPNAGPVRAAPPPPQGPAAVGPQVAVGPAAAAAQVEISFLQGALYCAQNQIYLDPNDPLEHEFGLWEDVINALG